MVFNMVGSELIHEFNTVKSVGGKLKVVLYREKAIDSLASGDGVNVPPAGKRYHAVREQFEVPGHLAFGFSDTFSKALDFTQVGRIEGKNAVCLTELGLLDGDGFGLVISWLWHLKFFIFVLSRMISVARQT